MSELQAEDLGVVYDEPEVMEEQVETGTPVGGGDATEESAEHHDSDSESAPDTAEAQEKETGNGETEDLSTPDGVQKVIDKKHFLQKEAERKAEEAEREAAELRERLKSFEQSQPEPQRPEVPPIPDPYAENYEELVNQRDEAIKAATKYDEAKASSEAAAESAKQAEEEAKEQEVKDKFSAYQQRAFDSGISPEKLTEYGRSFDKLPIDDGVCWHIIEHERSPDIVKAMHESPEMAKKISELSPMSAAVYIDKFVSGLSAGNATTKAPEPEVELSPAGETGADSMGIKYS